MTLVQRHRVRKFRIEEYRRDDGSLVVFVNGVETLGSFHDAIVRAKQAPFRAMIDQCRDMIAECRRFLSVRESRPS